jgi:hypothetical protein
MKGIFRIVPPFPISHKTLATKFLFDPTPPCSPPDHQDRSSLALRSHILLTQSVPPRVPSRTPVCTTRSTVRTITINPLILTLGTRSRVTVFPTSNIFRTIALAALRVGAQTHLFLIIAGVFAPLGHRTMWI